MRNLVIGPPGHSTLLNTHPLWIVELLVQSNSALASVVNTPVKVAPQDLSPVVSLAPPGETLAVPDAVQLAGVEVHLLPPWGRSLQ